MGIVDDPTKNIAEANSQTLQRHLWEWFRSTFLTRLEPEGCIIVVQTRWSSNDLIGYLLREHGDQWAEIRLPAIAEEGDILGREPGEPLCPDRYDVDALNEKKEHLGPQLFSAMYQQNPTSSGVEIFKRSWWQYFSPELLPTDLTIIQSWDCGYEKTAGSSYTVCVTIGRTESEFYILDVYRERLDFPELIRAVEGQYNHFRPAWVLVESHAAGISLGQVFKERRSIPLKSNSTGNKSKRERAYEVTHLVECGKVFLDRNASWIEVFLEELTEFPSHRYSDQVDAFTQGLHFLYRTNCRWVDGRPSLYKRPSSGRPSLYG
jgi:predicted phage terminase large subunit-like protein